MSGLEKIRGGGRLGHGRRMPEHDLPNWKGRNEINLVS